LNKNLQPSKKEDRDLYEKSIRIRNRYLIAAADGTRSQKGVCLAQTLFLFIKGFIFIDIALYLPTVSSLGAPPFS
jgi:hypothetical protein